jgi:hypothetical protein
MAVVVLRRYLCRNCGAVVAVGPREVTARRHYSASAIGWALALFGVAQLAAREVRRRVSPWAVVGAAAAAGWQTLRRWAKAVREGGLFPGVRASPESFSLRQVAARAATTLAASAPPSIEELGPRVFAGACAMT